MSDHGGMTGTETRTTVTPTHGAVAGAVAMPNYGAIGADFPTSLVSLPSFNGKDLIGWVA